MNNIIIKELSDRRHKLQQHMQHHNVDACIITSAVNLFYLTNFIFDGYFYIRQEGDPILFVKRPSGLKDENIVYIRKPEQIPEFIHDMNIPLPEKVMIESDSLSFSTASRLIEAMHRPQIMNASHLIRQMRSIKSAYEIDIMRESARIHAEVYAEIPNIYEEGMTDLQFQIELESVMRKKGSVGIFRSFGENMDIFMGSILAGENAETASPFDFALGGEGVSPLLPLGANHTPLRRGTTLMVDMAGNYRTYMDDMTRSFAIGYAPEAALKAHQISIDIHAAATEMVKPGVPCSALYTLAEQFAKNNGLLPNFMGTVQQAKFVGHGVGLEINEPPVLSPRSKDVLLPGMAIAFEPKFVLPGIGAVGIENTYIVDEKGWNNITVCEESLIVL